MKTIATIKNINSRLRSGEYKEFPATAKRIREIQNKLVRNIGLSDADYYVLESEKLCVN